MLREDEFRRAYRERVETETDQLLDEPTSEMVMLREPVARKSRRGYGIGIAAVLIAATGLLVGVPRLSTPTIDPAAPNPDTSASWPAAITAPGPFMFESIVGGELRDAGGCLALGDDLLVLSDEWSWDDTTGTLTYQPSGREFRLGDHVGGAGGGGGHLVDIQTVWDLQVPSACAAWEGNVALLSYPG